MSAEYYLDKLYPLQDEVLKILSKLNLEFYVTGGTVVGRFLIGHRFSDDLDFFVNNNPDFTKQHQLAYHELSNHFNIVLHNEQERFARFFVTRDDIKLKIEWVNDVGYHAGGFTSNNLFNKIDGYRNILSNKLCALTRNAPKDFSDLIYLSYHYKFNWEEVVTDVMEKDTWMREEKINEYICQFDPNNFSNVNWTTKPDFNKLGKDLIVIAKDILLGNDNSLYKG